MESMHGMLSGNRGAGPGVRLACPGTRNQFDLESVRISDCEYVFSETSRRFLNGCARLDQVFFPIFQRTLRNTERRDGDLTHANAAARSPRPREEGQNRSRRADFVRKIEVVCSRIVKIYGFLDQAKAQDLCVKI